MTYRQAKRQLAEDYIVAAFNAAGLNDVFAPTAEGVAEAQMWATLAMAQATLALTEDD